MKLRWLSIVVPLNFIMSSPILDLTNREVLAGGGFTPPANHSNGFPSVLSHSIVEERCAFGGCPEIKSAPSSSVSRQTAGSRAIDPAIQSIAPSTQDRSRHHQLQILLPLYSYPNWYDREKYQWKQVAAAAQRVPIVAIINPNNGPDRSPPNTDYQQGIEDLRQANVKTIGYVRSNYGKRSLKAVKADIDLYFKHFNVSGIFIDESASARDKLEYYQQLYKYIKSQSDRYQVIINPGTAADEGYVSQSVADVVVMFENQQREWNRYHLPAYTKKYSPQHFAALIHTTANSRLMKATLDRAAKERFGYVYITNDSTETANNNPWDTLPIYWNTQVEYIQKLNAMP
jgi:Spherulation-specific family 4